jgi:hypothetical protein
MSFSSGNLLHLSLRIKFKKLLPLCDRNPKDFPWSFMDFTIFDTVSALCLLYHVCAGFCFPHALWFPCQFTRTWGQAFEPILLFASLASASLHFSWLSFTISPRIAILRCERSAFSVLNVSETDRIKDNLRGKAFGTNYDLLLKRMMSCAHRIRHPYLTSVECSRAQSWSIRA